MYWDSEELILYEMRQWDDCFYYLKILIVYCVIYSLETFCEL